MKLRSICALVACAAMVGLVPTAAVADVNYNPGGGPNYHPGGGPPPGPPPHGKAFGFYCKGESKKHVKGQQGTAFSRCVKKMAQAAGDTDKTVREVCAGLSKKHVKGEKGTAFSRCVVNAAHMRRDLRKAGLL